MQRTKSDIVIRILLCYNTIGYGSGEPCPVRVFSNMTRGQPKMKANKLRHSVALLSAIALLGTAVPYSGMPVTAATADLSNAMVWGTLRIGGGGFVSGIVTGKQVMYARTDVGGAYKYDYDKEEWVQLLGFINDADRGLLSVDAMAIDPTDDNTVYFLCGCAYFSNEKTVVFITIDLNGHQIT